MLWTMTKAMFWVLMLSLAGTILTMLLVLMLGNDAGAAEQATAAEMAESGAQTVVDSIAADAAAFPWFMALIALLTAVAVVWFIVEMAKATAIGKLKRPPRKDASEQTVLRVISRQLHWYPLVLLLINFGFGFGSGMGIAGIDSLGAEGGTLGWWGAPSGILGGLLSKAIAQYLKKFSDAASDLLLGRLKRFIGRMFGGGGGGDKTDD